MVQSAQVAAAADARRLTILVAEDEVLVRMSIADDLRDAGYQVLQASTADEAVSILDSGKQVDLVFSDIQMPGALDGIDLLRVIRDRHPGIAVILTSGHLDPRQHATTDDLIFIPKPYVASVVLAEILRIIGT